MKKNSPSTVFKSSLQKLVSGLDVSVGGESVGTVTSFGDGVLRVTGLDDVQAGEIVDLGSNEFGLALNLEKNDTGIVALGTARHLKTGASVKRTGRILSLGVSDDIIGRVVSPLGEMLDGGADITVDKYMLLEKKAPGIMPRQSVTQPLQTGIKAIDAMIPIGRGQRELIIGDRSTGKTSVGLGTILNQADQNVICVYVCIGQKRSSLAQIVELLARTNALSYTTVVAATASASAAEKFLSPYAGQAIAEYFLGKGKDVLIIFDDLTKHAEAYREVSLLLRRPSGREAYPGDVFYLHSRLLERSCRLNQDNGGGSITALPIIETQQNDVSAFIPTNVISITDGQIYLESDLFNAGMKPAINVGLSVSRVGSAAQTKAMKQVAGTMKLDLAQFRELQAFAQFSSDLDKRTKQQLDRGERVNAVLKQGWDEPLKMQEQVLVIYAAIHGYLDNVKVDTIPEWEIEYLAHIRHTHQSLLNKIATEQKVSEETEGEIKSAIETFNSLHPDYLTVS